jgi:hypothetical protein
VSLAEEYLADHFPTFPVLPGVMMLEAITQAAAWLLHRRSDFAKSMAVLKEARNVKYGTFVAPGRRCGWSRPREGNARRRDVQGCRVHRAGQRGWPCRRESSWRTSTSPSGSRSWPASTSGSRSTTGHAGPSSRHSPRRAAAAPVAV